MLSFFSNPFWERLPQLTEDIFGKGSTHQPLLEGASFCSSGGILATGAAAAGAAGAMTMTTARPRMSLGIENALPCGMAQKVKACLGAAAGVFF